TPLTASDSVAINVLPVNDAPVNSVPAVQSVLEDAALVFSAANGNRISMSDVDDADNGILGDEIVRVTLTAEHGVLTLGTVAGLTFTSGDGTADVDMTFLGALANVNGALEGLSYRAGLNFNGPASLTITTTDLGNFGAGIPLVASDGLEIDVLPVNDAPVNSVPAVQSVLEDAALVFSTANGNRIAVSDVDDADNGVVGDEIVRVTLTAEHGVLTLGTVAGLTFTSGDGTADAGMIFLGALANVNSALEGLVYLPGLNFNGSA